MSMSTLDTAGLDPNFKDEVAARPGGENVRLCFACGTCTAACPVAAVDETFNPRQMIRMILLGMKRELLGSPVLWRCVQCYACYAKCPQNVKFRDVMKVLRALAVEQGFARADVAEELFRLDDAMLKEQVRLVNLLVADRVAYDRALATRPAPASEPKP
jgi:heterodisulfide reductase subunit C